jgi:CHAT domain-containing protein
LAQELYNILLGQSQRFDCSGRANIDVRSLDGVLRYVPVAALNDGKQYLVERYQNVVFTPASQARLKNAPSRAGTRSGWA